MTKPVVLIDFDHTLFDVDKLYDNHGDFDSIISFVKAADSLDDFLYPDALTFLKTLAMDFTPVIFSEGPLPYQQQKIEKTSLKQYIDPDHFFIFSQNQKSANLPKLIDLFHPICLIDDKPSHLTAASRFNLSTIRIMRGKNSDLPDEITPTFTARNLTQITDSNYLHQINEPLKHATHIHLVGIKGVGMTPVALMLQDLGKTITGSDTSDSQITDTTLDHRAITVTDFDANLPQDTNLVIYSGAYNHSQNPQLKQAQVLQIHTITQAQALATLTQNKKTIAVCGVGGKTTTTAMLATIFQTAHTDPSWFVGVSNFNHDWLPGRMGEGEFFLAEADEYAISPHQNQNPKFSLLSPQMIICTNLLHDHPDIYPDLDSTIKVFVDFFNKLPPDGLLIIQPQHYQLVKDQLTTKARIATFGDKQSGASHKIQIFPDDSFTINTPTGESPTIFPTSIGNHNIYNAAAAYIAALYSDIDPSLISKGISVFTSSKRRLEKIGYQNDILYYDDYGHHPEEIKATLKALKNRFLDRRIITIFHPHTYSRTKTLFDQFATAFVDTDIVIVADIFASARETIDSSISSAKLVEAIKSSNPNALYLGDHHHIVKHLKTIRQPGDLILTLGAGDIYKIHTELLSS